MENIPVEVASSPSGRKKIWVIVIVVTALTALIVGGGVYAWQQSIHQQQRAALQKEIDLMKSQLESYNAGDFVTSGDELNSSPSPSPLLRNSQEATAGWNTSENKKYGFSFKYPAGWYVFENDALYEKMCQAEYASESPTNNLTPCLHTDFVAVITNVEGFCTKGGCTGTDLKKLTTTTAPAKIFIEKVPTDQLSTVRSSGYTFETDNDVFVIKATTDTAAGEKQIVRPLSTSVSVTVPAGLQSTTICGVTVKVPSFVVTPLVKNQGYTTRGSENELAGCAYGAKGFSVVVTDRGEQVKFEAFDRYQQTQDVSEISKFSRTPYLSTSMSTQTLYKNISPTAVGYTAQIYQDIPGQGVYQTITGVGNKYLVYITYDLFSLDDKGWQEYFQKRWDSKDRVESIFSDYMALTMQNTQTIAKVDELNNIAAAVK